MRETMTVYIAASFKHRHGVRLLGRELERLDCLILDWTSRATPPPGLTAAEKRIWMDTDPEGGEVYRFCRDSCMQADLLIYYGASGQDAGVEVGMAAASGVPVLGIAGPLEAPGLMLHGAATVWVEDAEQAVSAVRELIGALRGEEQNCGQAAQALMAAICKREAVKPANKQGRHCQALQGDARG